MKRPLKRLEIAIILGLLVVLLPVLYYLALGPILFLANTNRISHTTAEIIYQPANWAVDHGWLPSWTSVPLTPYYQWWSNLAL
jgi:hypothetical protein